MLFENKSVLPIGPCFEACLTRWTILLPCPWPSTWTCPGPSDVVFHQAKGWGAKKKDRKKSKVVRSWLFGQFLFALQKLGFFLKRGLKTPEGCAPIFEKESWGRVCCLTISCRATWIKKNMLKTKFVPMLVSKASDQNCHPIFQVFWLKRFLSFFEQFPHVAIPMFFILFSKAFNLKFENWMNFENLCVFQFCPSFLAGFFAVRLFSTSVPPARSRRLSESLAHRSSASLGFWVFQRWALKRCCFSMGETPGFFNVDEKKNNHEKRCEFF